MHRFTFWLSRLYKFANNKRGAAAVEWLALADLVVGIMLVVGGYKGTFGDTITQKIQGFINFTDISGCGEWRSWLNVCLYGSA